jgi:hypothetical protein
MSSNSVSDDGEAMVLPDVIVPIRSAEPKEWKHIVTGAEFVTKQKLKRNKPKGSDEERWFLNEQHRLTGEQKGESLDIEYTGLILELFDKETNEKHYVYLLISIYEECDYYTSFDVDVHRTNGDTGTRTADNKVPGDEMAEAFVGKVITGIHAGPFGAERDPKSGWSRYNVTTYIDVAASGDEPATKHVIEIWNGHDGSYAHSYLRMWPGYEDEGVF